ncbi:MAG: tetratricopeptide repeat protein [Phycisphaerae bacterium]
MCRTFHILLLVSAASVSSEAFPDNPQYINSRAVILSYHSANAAEIDRAHVWVSPDDGVTWNETTVASAGQNAVRFDVRQDGKYCFYIVLENAGGRSGDPPGSGTKPHVKVIVDTAPPTMQIHKARLVTSTHNKPHVRLNVSLVEENLGEAGVHVFYRAKSGWQDGGPVSFSDGLINWRPPADISSRTDLRLVATDLAGNVVSDEIRGVSITAPGRTAEPVPPRADLTPAQAAPTEALEEVAVPPVPPVTVPPVPTVTLDEAAELAPATQPTPEAEQRAQILREQATRYLAQGRLSLAGARLQDALELAPDDADLQVDLGSVLYRARQYDEARRRFRAALDASPEHLGAIEGLALVAATQNRYPQARSHLQHLLRLGPESGKHWLHYGDIEHILGNAAAARAAWERALELERVDKTLREKVQKRLKLFSPKRTDAKH